MSEKPIKIEVPDMRVPCDECLSDSNHTFSNGAFIATYCRHRSAGALLDTRPGVPLQGVWRVLTPISEEVFALFVKRRADAEAAKADEAAKNETDVTWN